MQTVTTSAITAAEVHCWIDQEQLPELVRFIAAHGIDSTLTRAVAIKPDVVEFTLYQVDGRGRQFVDPATGEAAVMTRTRPRHVKLPNWWQPGA
jgi:hypothetical protein